MMHGARVAVSVSQVRDAICGAAAQLADEHGF
jgi:hypothetical protein